MPNINTKLQFSHPIGPGALPLSLHESLQAINTRMNRIKGILYNGISILARLGLRKKQPHKKLLVVRVDEIGDCMLWHNFIRDIAHADRFTGYRLYFCGNASVKPLIETFDATWISESIWLDKTRFKKDMAYRYRFLKKIYREGFDIVVNPTFSRDKRYDDAIVQAAQAKERIGMVANQETVAWYEKGYDKDLYTELFHHPERPLFEFYRNRLFTSFATKQHVTTEDTMLAKDKLPMLPFELPEKYFVVFPGSRSAKRIWPTEDFLQVSNYLFDTTNATAVVCGTRNDETYITAFCNQYTHPCINLMGRTSLTQMLTVFAQARCLVSVDTGSVHLAAAVGCAVFGVFNGSQYKRFAPYPKELARNFYAVYPDDVEQDLQDDELVKKKYEFVIDVPYASVPASKVIKAIQDSGIFRNSTWNPEQDG